MRLATRPMAPTAICPKTVEAHCTWEVPAQIAATGITLKNTPSMSPYIKPAHVISSANFTPFDCLDAGCDLTFKTSKMVARAPASPDFSHS